MRCPILVLALALPVAGQANTAPLIGTLLDPDGKPVPKVMIEVWRAPGKGFVCLDLALNRAYRRIARAPTDKNGRFALHLPIGLTCQVRVDHPPFARFVRDDTLPGEEITLRMVPGLTFSGVVVRKDTGKGEPASIRMWNRDTGEYHVTDGRTDALGRFRFERVPHGPMRIDVAPDRAMSPPWRDVEFEKETDIELRFEVDPGRVLRGRVVDVDTGKPIKGAKIGEGWTFNRGVVTGVDGRYELFGYGATGYQELHCLAPGYIKKMIEKDSLEDRNGDLTVDFELKQGEVATGRVVDGKGSPLQGVYVAVIARARDGRHDWIPTPTDAKGRFRIAGLQPKCVHVLMLRQPGWASVVYYLPKKNGGGVHPAGDIEMRRPRIVQGRVLGVGRQPVDRVKVGLWGANADRERLAGSPDLPTPLGGNPVWQTMRMYVCMRTVRTDEKGRFAFGDVPPGSYQLVIYDTRNRILRSVEGIDVGKDQDPESMEIRTDIEVPASDRK